VATQSGSGFQPLQRRLSSLRHFSGIPTQPELLTTLTCFKGRTLRHCQVEKNQPDAISILPENIERFNSINGREHLKAE